MASRPRPAARLHAFPDSVGFARGLARATGLSCSTIELHRFPDGESLVRVAHRGERHAVVVRSLDAPNEKLVETLLAADALRRAGAARVTLVAPYLAYMRQDAVFRAGEPISQRVVGAWLGAAFDRVLTVEAHLHRVRTLAEVIPGGSRSVSAAPVLAAWVRRTGESCVLVGPDEESLPWVRAIAERASVPWVVGVKQRLGDLDVQVRLPEVPAVRRAVIVDDIASSGRTLVSTAQQLRRAGIREIDAAVVHAIFARGAEGRIRRAGIDRLVSCDTIPHPTNGVAVAGLLAPLISPPLSPPLSAGAKGRSRA